MRDETKTKAELIAELRELRDRVLAASEPVHIEAPPSRHRGGGERYDHILENMRAMVVETDSEGLLDYVSPSVTEILGYAPEEVQGRPGLSWIHPEDQPHMAEALSKIVATEQRARYTYRVQHKSGHWVWLEGTSSPYRGSDGKVRIVAFARDITDMKLAGDALRDSEDRFRAIAENALDFIAELDDKGRFLFVSPNSQRLFGRAPEQMLGHSIGESGMIENIHPDDRARFMDGFRENVIGGGRGHALLRMRGGDESWRWFETTARTYRRSDGSVRVVIISRDVSDRVQAQDELRESEERYRAVAEASQDLISEMDAEGQLLYMSPTCKSVLGYEPDDLVGTSPFALMHPDDSERAVSVFRESIENRAPQTNRPYRVRHRDGSWRWLDGSGFPYETASGEVHFIAVYRDISEQRQEENERRKLEQQVQQAQKLESLGIMAGGIAHDFNNLLTPILGGTTLALMDLPRDAVARSRIRMIQKAAHRAAALTNQMLAYAGQESLSMEVVDLSKLVREMSQLLESGVSQKAEVVYELRNDVLPVEADAAQLSQVVMNLITNASESMGDGSGRISIRTGVVEVDRATLSNAIAGNDLHEGTYAYFEVEDTGCGMNAEIRARIFDPFYTTRFTGRGLGLAAVLGIVRSHDGAIELDSVPGVGTRFRVMLPRSHRSAPRPLPASSDIENWKGSGTILVVDDDDGVRDLTQNTLERAGLRVLLAEDGREAISIFRAHADEIGAVLLDRTMPGSSGVEVFDQLRRIRSDAKIVLVSGYSEESLSQQFAGRDLAGFLHKPFLPTSLLIKIQTLLQE